MSDDEKTPLFHKLEAAIGHHRNGRTHQAMALYKEVITLDSRNVIALNNYGALLLKENDLNGALTVLRQAVEIDPQAYDAWSNLGDACQLLQDYLAAINCYQKALTIKPTHAPALGNLASALKPIGEFTLAERFHKAALEVDPTHVETHTNYALFLLATGRYKEGFREYEWHWRECAKRVGRAAIQWDGTPLNGRTLLVYFVGGFGDAVQFSRFLPQLEKQNGQIIVATRKPLLALLRYSFPTITFVDDAETLPLHDVQTPIMSLAHFTGVTLETLPFSEGFLKVQPEKMAEWRERLQHDQGSTAASAPLRVGLVWAGAPHKHIKFIEFANRRRSLDLKTLAPLAEAVPEAIFYSLQIGDKKEQAAHPPAPMTLIDYTDHIHDFSDTAALITQLDVVVAVDTSTAHVAAGLGKPVMMLSRFDQCWRWLAKRSDSPWYDSLTIYQQKRPLDWSEAFEDAKRDLRAMQDAKEKAHGV
ncbi:MULTISPECIES: tetratricopeptide repeat protein [unclassified Saccharibacter]|uniref:tetratricopeptide repeat protein n=1 Tax=unclassified Saccharibacter TaxID=2648722 RepID=UPI00132296D9|nr:tetratricopeptide repeat protein [Saccharibacter sp. EH611]MXV56850.1 tetratricopeptide repeat protein [Saccharibacter sp. EH70]MXV66790.1 tetratricopeptide repeat protein [Saccharibacter sp. EH60]